ncbi:family 2A encapsulin nanocompartment cargo protein cysteine desulfurase [Methylobacterium sp. Leaf91]|uniref:family 2A encapsulin nanocompartment cargo protein cysteine desulfurase n=1 Tax=Methylobacterium sp. Leaf91 TaxID=1736247 RepID=UPI0006FF2D86|nr:family 2A encapsulin nanocompartment cargo protein cysteine desulfurase [Methylobacterium sp. Leaf91]KQP00209.1 cysteine desulfurase [Methylobacterium sp. Leaf91]
MTTPNAPGLPTGLFGDTAHADLVGRLAREIYGQGQAASAPLTPTLPQTPQAPQATPQLPQALENAPQGFGHPIAPQAFAPKADLGTPSIPSGSAPSGLQPDASALAARSFGAPPVGLPGLTGPGFAQPSAFPSVHPEAQAPRGGLPEFFVPSVADVAAFLPGGHDLHATIAKDHPRANAFAHGFAPSLVPEAPGHRGQNASRPDASQETVSRAGRTSPNAGRKVEIADEPFSPGEYYFLTDRSRTGNAAPAPSTRHEPRPGHAPHVSSQGSSPVAAPFDVERVRKDFPALHQSINGHPLVWLDNAATTHKPQSVIDATSEFYARHNSNIHRAAHTLAARSTDLFEGGREKVRRFINAASTDEIIFLRGTTEAINLVANSYGRANIGPGDEIIISTIEHHANIVPWQLLTQATGATLRVIPVDDRGEIIFEQFATLLSGRTKIVSVTHVANAMGTINPVREIIALSHAYGVPVLVDAAQSSPHIPLDVQALDADFLVFSGHKVFGPTGIGALYGKRALLEAMPPWQGGGHMIEDVTFSKTVYKGVPEKFEAGTPDIAGAVGLGAALDYLESVGLPGIAAYEHDLLEYAQAGLAEVKGLRLIGTARQKASVMSFVVDGHDNEAVAKHLDARGIAVRSGHHCALPALRRFGVDQSVRASLAFYNTRADVDAFLKGLHSLPRR